MSRKFRWFLLAACAFVVLMGGRETLALLAGGPQTRSASPEFQAQTKLAVDKRATKKSSPQDRLASEAELARGERND